jgi:hypothetical protein
MAYVVKSEGGITIVGDRRDRSLERTPYQVQYSAGGRRRVKRFPSLVQAEGFRRRLPMGAQSSIKWAANGIR